MPNYQCNQCQGVSSQGGPCPRPGCNGTMTTSNR